MSEDRVQSQGPTCVTSITEKTSRALQEARPGSSPPVLCGYVNMKPAKAAGQRFGPLWESEEGGPAKLPNPVWGR